MVSVREQAPDFYSSVGWCIETLNHCVLFYGKEETIKLTTPTVLILVKLNQLLEPGR